MSKPIEAPSPGEAPGKPAARRGWVFPDRVKDIEAIPATPAAPFRYLRTITWADCDPAQIAYTGNIPNWCLEALEAWYKAVLGANWFELNLDHGLGTPFVHLENDFKFPVTARHDLELIVRVSRLGSRSLAHTIEGRQGGTLCFTGSYASAMVAAVEMKAISLPPMMREAVERFVAAQDGQDAQDGAPEQTIA